MKSSINEIRSKETAKITLQTGDISFIAKVLGGNFAFISETQQPAFCYDVACFHQVTKFPAQLMTHSISLDD